MAAVVRSQANAVEFSVTSEKLLKQKIKFSLSFVLTLHFPLTSPFANK
jgi:hypothetical protein